MVADIKEPPRPALPCYVPLTINYSRCGQDYVSRPVFNVYIRRRYRAMVSAAELSMNFVLPEHAESHAMRKGGDVLSGYLEVWGDWLLGYDLSVSLDG